MGLLAFLFRVITALFVFRLAGIVFRAFMGGLRSGARPDAPSGSTQRGRPQDPGRIEELVRDPVCGVHTARSSAIPGRFEGRDAFFCSEECAAKARA
jgi:YHS domain-containing protein